MLAEGWDVERDCVAAAEERASDWRIQEYDIVMVEEETAMSHEREPDHLEDIPTAPETHSCAVTEEEEE